jgi:hypothetical protein
VTHQDEHFWYCLILTWQKQHKKWKAVTDEKNATFQKNCCKALKSKNSVII